MFKKVEYSSSSRSYEYLLQKYKRSIFKQVSKNSPNYFLRGQDLISQGPIVSGVHEPDLTKLIAHFSEIGYCDFLIDIGANIGLTSCQNGSAFNRVLCFEPNPLCLHVLKVNTEIALPNIKCEINEFGLGESDGEFDLWIPKFNWGGAFVRSKENSYSDNILAKKDEFFKIDPNNYLLKKIQIRSCRDTMLKKFSSLSEDEFKKGVIKIDVEGMEEVVLKGIAESIPAEFKVMVIFENWDPDLNFYKIKEYFSVHQSSLFTFKRYTQNKKNWKRLFGNTQLLLTPLDNSENNVEDIVVQIGNLVDSN